MTGNKALKRIKSIFENIWRWKFFPIIILALITFCAHFLLFQQLGVYDDDIAFVIYPYQTTESLSRLPLALVLELKRFFQGRPIGFMLTTFLVAIFGKLGGLPGIYLAGFLTIWINASLMYLLIFKRTKIKLLAFLAAVVFTLYPADTTHTFLCHNLSLQYALTWLLLAFHFDLANKKWLAYSFAGLILVTYETPFWIFLSAPLFQPNIPKKDLRKKLFRHFVIMVAILMVYIFLRFASGEERLLETAAGSVNSNPTLSFPFRIPIAMFIGPITSLSTFLLAPITTIRDLTPIVLAGTLLSFGGFFLLLKHMNLNPHEQENLNNHIQISQPHFSANITSKPDILICVQLFLANLPAMALAYAFSFTLFPPHFTTGRLSSVHMASALPGSIFVATLFYLGISLFKQRQKKRLGIFSIAVILSLIFGYSILIQEDFKLGWMKTRRMMTQVFDQIQDIGPNTTVMVDITGLRESRYILSYTNELFSYGSFRVIFSREPDYNPKIIILTQSPPDNLSKDESGQYYYNYRYHPPCNLEDGNIIYIAWNGKRFMRQYGEIQILDTTFKLKPLGEATLPDIEKTFLYYWFYQPEFLDLEGPIEPNTLFH